MARGGGIALLDRDDRRLHETLEEPLDLLVQDGVLDRGRGRAGERAEELLVLGAEGALPAVQRLEHADDLAARVSHRHGEDGAGPVPRRLVHGRLEPRVGVRVGDPDRRPAGGDRAGDAGAERDPDRLGAVGDLAPELRPLAVDEEERAAIGLGDPRGLVHHEREEAIEVPLRGHRLRDLEDRLELREPPAERQVSHVRPP